MRISGANEFKFDFGELELTAYFDDSGNLIHVDTDDFDLTGGQVFHAKRKAKSDYEEYLKQQEADAKDWENNKWHLEKQFKVF